MFFVSDRVFSADESTHQLYQDIAKPLVVSAVEGYNGEPVMTSHVLVIRLCSFGCNESVLHITFSLCMFVRAGVRKLWSPECSQGSPEHFRHSKVKRFIESVHSYK